MFCVDAHGVKGPILMKEMEQSCQAQESPAWAGKGAKTNMGALIQSLTLASISLHLPVIVHP